MPDESIKEQACSRCRNDIDRQFATNEKRLDDHAEDIQDLKLISNKLTQIQESMDKRLEVLEQQNQTKQGFYNSDVFKWIVKALIVIGVMIVGAAIGHSVNLKDIFAN